MKFTTSENVKAILNCHCNLCRKANGSAFSTYVVFLSSDFSLEKGTLKTVKISENASKSFCCDCATPIFNENPKYAGLKIVYLGALDKAQHLAPVVDTYCESQLQWITQMDNLKKMEQGFGE
ncbi:GFA family protein [Planctobacterium marinum]|uniref:GFA family protein n=1 Tax=Planctobacterium marinum TaxID=1631968 RepID=UPI0030C67EE3